MLENSVFNKVVRPIQNKVGEGGDSIYVAYVTRKLVVYKGHIVDRETKFTAATTGSGCP
jgi:hypothetical protein